MRMGGSSRRRYYLIGLATRAFLQREREKWREAGLETPLKDLAKYV